MATEQEERSEDLRILDTDLHCFLLFLAMKKHKRIFDRVTWSAGLFEQEVTKEAKNIRHGLSLNITEF